MLELPKLVMSHEVSPLSIPDMLMVSIREKIREHEEERGTKPKYIVLSEVMYFYLNSGARHATGTPGNITKYLGLDIIVLDRGDTLLLVG